MSAGATSCNWAVDELTNDALAEYRDLPSLKKWSEIV